MCATGRKIEASDVLTLRGDALDEQPEQLDGKRRNQCRQGSRDFGAPRDDGAIVGTQRTEGSPSKSGAALQGALACVRKRRSADGKGPPLILE